VADARGIAGGPPPGGPGAGFTLPDLLVVLVLLGLVTALAVPGVNRFLRAMDLNDRVHQAAATIRVIRQSAVTERNEYVLVWDDTVKGWAWYDDDNRNGSWDEGEKKQDAVPPPAWITITNSQENPFPSPATTFYPDGSASQSGTRVYSNSDGYKRSLSVVRPTGMVTVQ
jgi:type II secretory pathway pseudopilin PulG